MLKPRPSAWAEIDRGFGASKCKDTRLRGAGILLVLWGIYRVAKTARYVAPAPCRVSRRSLRRAIRKPPLGISGFLQPSVPKAAPDQIRRGGRQAGRDPG